MEKRIDVTCGQRVETEKGTLYIGGATDNGWCYKDLDAWKSGKGIIYIGEYALEEYEDLLKEGNDFADVEPDGYTRDSWLEMVRSNFADDNFPEEFIEWFAEAVLLNCDWQELTTLMTEWEECVEEDYEYFRSQFFTE